MTRNKHGLARSVPAAVKRAVRQRDGFGCVICGNALFAYEHVDPTFAEAKQHDVNCITLLCGLCHDKVTRGFLSKETVKGAMAKPKCRQIGFSFGVFDVGMRSPTLTVGAATVSNVRSVIRINERDVLAVKPPEKQGGPFRISAQLSNSLGTETLRIVDNEFQSRSSNWDVEITGSTISIRNKPGDIALVLRASGGLGLSIDRLDMYRDGARIMVRPDLGLVVRSASGNEFTAAQIDVNGSDVAFDVNASGRITVGSGGGEVYFKGEFGGPNPATGWPAVIAPPIKTYRTRSVIKIGPNDPCPCGSGIKYKKCHNAAHLRGSTGSA